MNVAQRWGLAFFRFAQTTRDMMPADFQQAAANYPELSQELATILAETGVNGANGDGFEITFQGRLGEIENPARAIIMREKEPFHVDADGTAQRTYLFADGHSEIHWARDGNFERWESERWPKLKGEQRDSGE
jgi:prepilin-type processing-associated H-X9-DG protein